MSVDERSGATTLPALDVLLSEDDVKACCAAVYAHPAVRWLLGDELHPGGEATTRRALELIGVRAGERVLDVASGAGTSALLAARELGCSVVGIEYGEGAVQAATAAARDQGLGELVSFRRGDAEALPFGDDEFAAVLCECSLCTFPDKRLAVAEMRRVLEPGGRVALCDVVVERERLPAGLDGALATIACVGEALSRRGYEDLLDGAGLRVTAVESRAADAAVLARRVEDRLRGVRILGLDTGAGSPLTTDEAIELVRSAQRAIADGALGYTLFAAHSA
jgi:arsenite methyltransferase